MLIRQKQLKLTNECSEAFVQALNDDLNISNSLTTIHELLKQINITIRAKQYKEGNDLLSQLITNLSILGIEFENIHTSDNINLINEYYDLLEAKQFDKSDSLRKQLLEKGLI